MDSHQIILQGLSYPLNHITLNNYYKSFTNISQAHISRIYYHKTFENLLESTLKNSMSISLTL